MPKININIHRPQKEEPPKPTQEDLVWPTMLDDEEDEPTLVELTLYDYATVKDNDGNWTDIADWYNDDLTSVLWEDQKTFYDNKPFNLSPRTTNYKVYGNVDSKVRSTIIEEEFSSDNPDRWERKPLATRPEEWRFQGNRWYIGGTYEFIDPATGQSKIASDFSQFNIHVELCTNSDPESAAAKIDPDLFHDGKAKRLKLKHPQMVDEIQPLIYRGNFPGQKLGIRVKDQSKSFGHYVSSSGLGYTYDWIDGIYFCTLDTTDTDNFKVTMEPNFSAEEVSGKMITPGKYDLGLIPRRWFYVFHYRHQVNQDEDFQEYIYGSANGGCDSYLSFYWGNINNNAVKTQYTQSSHTLRAYESVSTHYVVSFWGRPPCNFTARWFHEDGRPQAEDTAPVGFFNDQEQFVGTVDMTWSETYEQAQAHFISAGGSPDEAQDIRTGGLSGNLHICTDNTDYFVKVGNESNESWGTLRQIGSTCFGSPVITRSDVSYAYQGFDLSPMGSPEFGIGRLWQVIEESKAWTNLIKPLRDKALTATSDATVASRLSQAEGVSAASRIDMIPWGVGVSPSKTGDLVGVIRIRERAYFVWRKTDEEFTPKIVGSQTTPIRFESNDLTGKLGVFSEGCYGTLEAESTNENVYDADYCDLFIGDSARKLTHVGRNVTSVNEDADEDCDFLYPTHAEGENEGAVKLDTPVFVMLTKERAFSDFEWWQSYMDGWNIRLLCRCARCSGEFTPQSADVRNSY